MEKYNGEGFEFVCLFKAETQNAVFVYDYATKQELWLPLSAVKEMHRPANWQAPGADANGRIVIEMWLAKKRGLA